MAENDTPKVVWNDGTMAWVYYNSHAIDRVADILGVPATAIAGQMAKENHLLRHDMLGQQGAETFTVIRLSGWSDEKIVAESIQHENDTIPPGLPGKIYKARNPVLVDLGLANFQVATAVTLLERYKKDHSIDDPLGIMEYADYPHRLIDTLAEWNFNPDPDSYIGDKGTRLTVALYGLMMKEGMEFFNTHADPQYWNNLDQVTRDAVLVTYCSLGRAKILDNMAKAKKEWEKSHDEPWVYEPKPGDGGSGGTNHMHNAPRIGWAMKNPQYGRNKDGNVPYHYPETDDQIRTPASDLSNSKTRSSPLALDLDGDGLETTGLADGFAYFDHDADGFAERSGWVSPDDGLLVWDRNQNGRIDNGRELFGDETLLESGSRAANGFAALKDLDTNRDGKIDGGDDQFSSLRIWRDEYSDGWCDSTELFTLDELGIESIDVASNPSSYVDAQGNAHKQVGAFTKTDGSTGATADVCFQTDAVEPQKIIRPVANGIPPFCCLWNSRDHRAMGGSTRATH